MTRPLVYIAGPITGDPWGCVRKATDWSRILESEGLDAYLPQLSVLHEMFDPQPYGWWIEHGLNMLSRCDGLFRLPGESPGADREVNYALELGLPVLNGNYKLAARGLNEWVAYVWAQHAYRSEQDAS